MAAIMRAVNQPESWWGWHGWNQPEPLSIVELMQAGTLSPRMAAMFWLGLERGASFIFAADPPGAGKTTILTALLTFAHPEMVAYFTRGWGETFELPPVEDGHPTYLMVNEISDHLPVYSWGPYVVRIFELLDEGYSLCSTLHADTIEGVLEQLSDDVGVASEHLSQLTFVAPLAIIHREAGTLRRVLDVGLVEDGATVRRLATWDDKADAFSVLEDEAARAALAKHLGIDATALDAELAAKEAFMERLFADGVSAIPEVQEALDAYRRDGASES